MHRYGIEQIDQINWISDRGSNFIKCFNLNLVNPIFCFAHRIRNILTITFINKKINDYFNDEIVDDIPDNLGHEEFLDGELLTPGAKRELLTINYSKVLVHYVKQVHWSLFVSE